MKKDIVYPEVTDVAVCIVKESNDLGEEIWNVYLVNLKGEDIENVFVSSKGYGTLNGEEVKTSLLRHFIGNMPALTFNKVEPIMEDVFALTNEFWVSFYENNVLYDKKFIFLPETIKEEYLTQIPVLFKKGVIIK
jgi:hypothetical protein